MAPTSASPTISKTKKTCDINNLMSPPEAPSYDSFGHSNNNNDHNDANGRSRVLRIVGDQQIVRPDYLFRVAAKEWLIQFDTDYFEFVEDRTRGWNEITWAFGSYRAQAQFVCKAINQCFNGRAQAVYLADPCSQ
ncbi:hypothetical protein NUW58_g3586 [Xylaria curta]|uniref:Uncharacterized protein n=1 Tax=Xylaria curta TaxID=42375 RepID=A0ACC1PDD2_9PEZI|nr:hypothetical protein NUW58_g3586 [Xylaria curta]